MGMIRTDPVTGPAVWKGGEIEREDSWMFRLTPHAVAEIDEALQAVERKALPMSQITRMDFPLPVLGKELERISRDLESGRGFVQIKGLPIERYTLQQAKIAYWGVGTYFGRAISQNAKGDLLGDVRDEGLNIQSARVRGYQTRAASPFHVDESDVVGLLCWRPARRGGASLIVSSMALYNELLRRYPWYLGVLYDRFNYDWRGEQPKGRPAIYRWPIFEYYDGLVSCRYSRRMIEFAQKTTGVMLSDIQQEAFDVMDELIEELQLCINFEPGDMQFLNNYVILHSRTAFEDHLEPDKKRHLLRLWLTAPDGRRLSPETLRERNVRDGVPVAEPATD